MKTAENLCFGFGCWGKDFFAKVSTYVNGYNSRTGSNWSQESMHIGNTTYTNGRAANGNSWDMTTQRIGDTTFMNGRNSQGNYFSKTCNQFGCY